MSTTAVRRALPSETHGVFDGALIVLGGLEEAFNLRGSVAAGDEGHALIGLDAGAVHLADYAAYDGDNGDADAGERDEDGADFHFQE